VTKVVKVIAAAWCLFLVGMIALSPFGIQGVNQTKANNQAVQARKDSSQRLLSAAETDLVRVVNAINDAREFDVSYADLENLNNVFTSVAGVSVQESVEVYPMDNFREGGPIVEGQTKGVSAVRYTLVVDDVWNALGVIEHMELPVYSVVIDLPDKIDLTFMTGGDI